MKKRDRVRGHEEEDERSFNPSPALAEVDIYSHNWTDASSEERTQGERGCHGRSLVAGEDIRTGPRSNCQYRSFKCLSKESEYDYGPDVLCQTNAKGKECRDRDRYQLHGSPSQSFAWGDPIRGPNASSMTLDEKARSATSLLAWK